MKKLLSTLLLATVILALLAGCTSPATTGGTTAGTTKGTTTTAAGTTTTADSNMEGNMYLTGLPIVKEKETLNFFIVQPEGYPSNFAGIAQVERFAQETNLELIWNTVPSAAWAERKAIMIAGKDLPDVIAGGGITVDEQIAWGAQGLIVELSDLIDNYMPRFQEILAQHPEYLELMKLPDGTIYSFIHTADIDFGMRGSLLYVNTDWLDAAGVPYTLRQEKFHSVLNKNLTLDEFKETLRLFKAAFPGGYPLSGTYNKLSAFMELYGAFGRVETANHINVENGKVIFTAAQNEWKNAVKYFNGLWSEGLIDPEYFTQEYNTYLAKSQQSPAQFGFGLVWTAHQYDNSMGDAYKKWAIVLPLVGDNNKQEWLRNPKNVGKGIYSITSACKNPAVAARFQDYLYDEDNSYQLSMGEYGGALVKNPDGTLDMIEFETENPTGLNMMFIGTPEMYARVNFADPTQMTIDVGMEYRPFQPAISQSYPNINLTAADTDKMSTLRSDINTYVAQMQAKWITEGGIDAEWDSYLAELKKIGLDEMMEILQRNYDNTLK
jgi:putative aldouronate transport system substrate-binding protein